MKMPIGYKQYFNVNTGENRMEYGEIVDVPVELIAPAIFRVNNMEEVRTKLRKIIEEQQKEGEMNEQFTDFQKP